MQLTRLIALVTLAALPAHSAPDFRQDSFESGQDAATSTTAPDAIEPLERALAAVHPEALRADLHFLAAQELGGRGTPSPELEVAARFIESRLRRLGLAPGTRDGYQHRFELTGRRLDVDASAIVASGSGPSVSFEYGTDAFLRGGGDLHPVALDATVVSVGDGSRGDVGAAGDLSHAWALVADTGRGTPGAIRRSLDAGAEGVLLTPGPEYSRDSYADRYGRAAARMSTLRFASPLAAPAEVDERPPSLFLSRAAGAALLRASGLDELPPPGTPLRVTVAETRVVEVAIATAPNVAALLPGTDPAMSGQVLVLCAHLDHLGTDSDGVVHPGADDNASGSVGLLALAEAIVARGAYGRSILFLWVSGEESGLWGSAVWCRDPRLPDGYTPRAALNLDMIGRDAPATLWVTPTAEHAAFNPLAALGPELAALEGFSDIVSQDSYWSASDHYSFASELRVPVLYLSSGEHDDYHQPTDLPARVDIDKLARIVRLTLRILERTDALELAPVETVGGRRR